MFYCTSLKFESSETKWPTLSLHNFPSALSVICLSRGWDTISHAADPGMEETTPNKKTLSKKNKSTKKPCPGCHKYFLRLDTHLRTSRACSVFVDTASSEQPLDNHPHSLPSPHRQSQLNLNVPSEVSLPPPSIPLPYLKTPETEDAWKEIDQYLTNVTVPAVLNASTVEDKNEALCGGVYQAFSSMCGTFDTQYKPRRVRKHARRLKRLTAQKNEARKRFRQAKKSTASESNIGLLAQEFYHLVRLHSAEKRLHLKSRCRLEALKARGECNKSFWKFAEKLFDAECVGVEPQFGAKQAEEYFRKVYSADPCSFTQPEWLPSSPPLSVDFNTDPISVEEISLVIKCAKSKSASSPLDRVSYHILKRCSSLLPALCDLYNACWSVPPAWKQAVIHLIPKSSAATSPSDPCNPLQSHPVWENSLHPYSGIDGFHL